MKNATKYADELKALCKRLIKQNPETAGIFVMFLSGEFTSSEEQAAGLDAGAEGTGIRQGLCW